MRASAADGGASSNDPNRPLVSVLTPSFNQAKWLGDNLRSVSSQTYPRIEHIVMDGGSTDGSVELLEAETPPLVRWRSESDRGQSDALNKALADSTGEIIGWINSDDAYADTRAIERAVSVFDRHPAVDVVYGAVLEVTADGEVIGVAPALPAWRWIRTLGVNPVRQPGAFIRRSALAGGFVDPALHYVMDHELFLRLLDSGCVFLRVPEVVAVNRRTPGRKSMAVGGAGAVEHEWLFGGRRGTRGFARYTARYIVSVLSRASGLPRFLTIERHLSPAITLAIPALGRRLRLQLATRLDRYASRRGRP